MKTIMIAGAGSNVGKTTILRLIKTVLPNSVTVKLGKTEAPDKDKEELLLPSHYSLADIEKHLPFKPDYLLIEGNSILKNLQPDLAIFVDGDPIKIREDAKELKEKCDLVIGEKIECQAAFGLAKKIGVNTLQFGKLLDKIGMKIKSCQLGCF